MASYSPQTNLVHNLTLYTLHPHIQLVISATSLRAVSWRRTPQGTMLQSAVRTHGWGRKTLLHRLTTDRGGPDQRRTGRLEIGMMERCGLGWRGGGSCLIRRCRAWMHTRGTSRWGDLAPLALHDARGARLDLISHVPGCNTRSHLRASHHPACGHGPGCAFQLAWTGIG